MLSCGQEIRRREPSGVDTAMTGPQLSYFSVMLSGRGDRWFVYDMGTPGQVPLHFFESADDAWAVAAVLNGRYLSREQRERWAALTASVRETSDHEQARRMKDWEDRLDKEAQFGLANTVCLSALSLPA
jgi:hypothetical protein